MVKYYFFPKIFEVELSNAIIQWAEKADSYVVVTGVYKPAEILDTSNTWVFNKSILGEIQYVVKGFKTIDNNFISYIIFKTTIIIMIFISQK